MEPKRFILVDYNARPHRANVVDTFLDDHDIHHMDWPAKSADLNPIKNVWGSLKRRISRIHIP